MANPLLDPVLPAEMASNSQVVDYKGKLGDFERLREIAENELGAATADRKSRNWQDAPVAVKLEFGWLDTTGGMPAATGRILAMLPAVCQRCLEAFELAVDTPVQILFASEDADTNEVADFDTWESGNDAIRLQDVVEEAIVMALPLAPAHESEDDCGALVGQIPEALPDTAKPFADLRARMDELDK